MTEDTVKVYEARAIGKDGVIRGRVYYTLDENEMPRVLKWDYSEEGLAHMVRTNNTEASNE